MKELCMSFTLTTSKGYVVTVAPSFAIAPTTKTFLNDKTMLTDIHKKNIQASDLKQIKMFS
jgi:hypothetical protein